MYTHYPTHVAALQDTVAVLTSSYNRDTDFLFLSSTGLHSWTSIDLPCQFMSLTIYQSKFVLVGGLSSNGKPTNQLLTSTTGQQWEPSLPPMPTKRYETSPVSTQSPEVLVVAGGRGSNYEDLDEVEVLQGDKWLKVDLLPAPASGMHSTLHDGKLFFMRHGHSQGTLFTCSCTSLISSCSKSSGNSSTKRPLWQQFQAPDGWGITISYSSRLVFIDVWGRVRRYSSITQSWLTVATTRHLPDRYGAVAATVINTGEVILAHQHDGVCKGAGSGEIKQ